MYALSFYILQAGYRIRGILVRVIIIIFVVHGNYKQFNKLTQK